MAEKKPSASAETATPKPFRVRAIRMGYIDHHRQRVGDVFMCPSEALFSKRWMERVSSVTPLKTTGAPEAMRQEHNDILRGKVASASMTNSERAAAGVREADDDPLDS